MATRHHHEVVRDQYDERASAYLTSTVHAQGADLEAMAERVGAQPEATLLDLGCGGGHVAFRLALQVGQVLACDLSDAMLSTVMGEAQRRGLSNLAPLASTAESLPCADASLDIVATRYSAHHWQSFPAGLAQMQRVLKPGGLALCMDVVTPGQPLLDTWLQAMELLRDPSHVRNYAVGEWLLALAQVGLQVESVTTYRLRLAFASWVARMRTPPAQVAAIRALQAQAGTAVAEAFALEEDGSFTVDTALIVARQRGG